MPAGPGPIRAAVPASGLFCQHVLQHRLVEAQIDHQFLQPQVFLFQLAHVLQLRGRNTTVFLALRIERGIRNVQLTADLRHRRTQFGRLQSALR